MRPFVSFSKGACLGKCSSRLVIVSCGCRNRLPQGGGLETTGLHPLSASVPKARSASSKCRQGHTPSEGFRGKAVPPHVQPWWSWWPWLMAASLLSSPLWSHSLLLGVSVRGSFCLFLRKTHTEFQAHPNPAQSLDFTLITSAKVTFRGSRWT